MTSFANPAGSAGEAAARYTRALLDLLGDHDPLDVQAAVIEHLRALTSDLSDELLRKPERDGKWSIIEVIQHMADTEIVFAYRIRMALAHDRPQLAGFDQDLWAKHLHYRDRDLTAALAQLDAMRTANLALYRTLDDAALERAAIHAERGVETVAHMLRLIAAHDLVHRAQIERIRTAVGAGTS